MSDSCDLTDCGLPGSCVHRILQARILEWVAISFSRGSSWPRNWMLVSCIAGRFFTNWTKKEAHKTNYTSIKKKKGNPATSRKESHWISLSLLRKTVHLRPSHGLVSRSNWIFGGPLTDSLLFTLVGTPIQLAMGGEGQAVESTAAKGQLISRAYGGQGEWVFLRRGGGHGRQPGRLSTVAVVSPVSLTLIFPT